VEAVQAASAPRCCAVCGEGWMVLVGLLPRAQPVGVGLYRGEDSS
jgi:hypothetical protein